MLQRYEMLNCSPIGSPANPSAVLSPYNSETDVLLPNPRIYQEAVGSLLYLSCGTRPDIAFAVNQAAKFTHEPTELHWQAVKRIFRYVRGTLHFGVEYGNCTKGLDHLDYTVQIPDFSGSVTDFSGFADSSYAMAFDAKSVTGFVFLYNGGPISWASRRQTVTALSTSEAELIALSSAAKELVWLRKLLFGLGISVTEPTPIFEDNQAAIKIASNSGLSARTKHIRVRDFYVRELVTTGDVILHYCTSRSQLADMFTKPLPAEKLREDCAKIMKRLLPSTTRYLRSYALCD
jgi:hypothetical protein